MIELLLPVLLFMIYWFVKQNIFWGNENPVQKWLDYVFYFAIVLFYWTMKPVYGVVVGAIIVVFIFADVLNVTGSSRVSTMAPLKIHQTWHSKTLPPKMAECVNKLKRENPEFEYYLYDDADCREMIRTHFDSSVLDAYDRIIPGTFKADLWRYCVLYIEGGVYLDIKFQCENGFKLVDLVRQTELYNRGGIFVREYSYGGDGEIFAKKPIYTGCMITRAKNPLFMGCIQKIVENVRQKNYGREHTEPTGPVLVGGFFTEGEKAMCKYAYYEEKGVGYIRHIDRHNVILSHYAEYRNEQRQYAKTGYWKELWLQKKIYAE
jgi:hypothetical protein